MMNRSGSLRRTLLTHLAFGMVLSLLFAPLPAKAAHPASVQTQSAYTTERAPVYHAFIFANDAYAPLTQIPSAAQDFTVMRDFFQQHHYRIWAIGGDGRFHNVQQFYAFMTKAREEIQPGDVVVIYYSGHGFHYGDQNWLVPLDYPSKPVDPQRLFQTAVGLNDVINGLAEKRVDYIVTILDSCRTNARFPMAGDTSAGEAETPDPILTGFNFSGPSLLAWLIGVPTQTGGQALGTSSAVEPSLYTGMLAKALERYTKLSKIQTELRSAVHNLELSGKIGHNEISPRFINNDFDFDFSPQADPAVAAEQKREWMNVMREPSRRVVSDYLIRNPGSSYSTAAWQYMDAHATDPIDDSSGFTATDPEKVDAAFSEGKSNGKFVAIATPGFKVMFPRNALGQAPTSRETIRDAIIYADKENEIADLLALRHSEKGSKLNFDASQLQGAGSLKGTIKQLALSLPDANAQVIAQFDRSTSYKISETFLNEKNDTLFARVQTGLAGEPASEGVWTAFTNDPKAFEFNNLNRALQETYITPQGLIGGPSESTIAAVTSQVKKASKDILWVSVAVDYRPVDLAPLQQKLKDAEDENTRAEIDIEIDRASRMNRRALAEANLRSLDARLQLISAGIDGKTISIVGDSTGSLGEGVRLRYFGSR